MLELCFDLSTCGSLRQAQHCGSGSRKVFGVIVGRDDGRPATRKEIRQALKQAQREQEALEREAIPLGGNAGDVLGLSLGLDMGDIREPLGRGRQELLRQWYDGNDEAAGRDWQETLESADRLRALGPGDTVRIWVDHTPASACGLLHAASLLEKTGAAVRITKWAINLVGEQHIIWAIALSSAILGIPIWADTVVILLIPIVSLLAVQTKKSMMCYGTTLYLAPW